MKPLAKPHCLNLTLCNCSIVVIKSVVKNCEQTSFYSVLTIFFYQEIERFLYSLKVETRKIQSINIRTFQNGMKLY